MGTAHLPPEHRKRAGLRFSCAGRDICGCGASHRRRNRLESHYRSGASWNRTLSRPFHRLPTCREKSYGKRTGRRILPCFHCLRRHWHRSGASRLATIGKKTVSHYLKNEKIRYSFSGVGDYWRFSQTKEISDFLISSFLSNKYQKIYIVYTHFYSSFIQRPTAIQLFPVRNETIEEFLQGSTGEDVNKEYILEPSPEVILDEIIPVFVQYLIYQFILSANTSEHSARMMAMRNASDNAKGLLENLRLAYNKARQAQITSEVSEISSTKEAMG